MLEAIKYNIKRNRKNYGIIQVLPYILLFFLIVLSSSMKNSVAPIMISKYSEMYPMNLLPLGKDKISEESKLTEIIPYKQYTAMDGDVQAVYYSDKKNSVLGMDNMLCYGIFPKNSNEIMLDYQVALKKAEKEKCTLAELVGRNFLFLQKDYVISGIVYDKTFDSMQNGANPKFEMLYNADIFYRRTKSNCIYMDYNELSQIGTETDNVYNVVMAVCPELSKNYRLRSKLRSIEGQECLGNFDQEIVEVERTIQIISYVIEAVLIVISLIGILFLKTQIELELGYRKKELGFMQIFGVPLKKIKKICFSDYILRTFFALMYTAISCCVFFLITGVFNLKLIPELLQTVIVLFVVIALYLMNAKKNIRRFLKQPVKKLITKKT